MSFYALAALAEAIVIAGSGIDARWRIPAQRRAWLARWFWWHLAPLWLLLLALTAAFMRRAEAVAGRSAEAYAARRHNASALVVDDEAPSTVSGLGAWRGLSAKVQVGGASPADGSYYAVRSRQARL